MTTDRKDMKLIDALVDSAFNLLQHDTGPMDEEYRFLRGAMIAEFSHILCHPERAQIGNATNEWLTVPREPTKAMIKAGRDHLAEHANARRIYKAMLDAAPSAIAQPTSVPNAKPFVEIEDTWVGDTSSLEKNSYNQGWNDCRDVVLAKAVA